MRDTEIYYFSGTGNSFAVARDLAARLDGKLTPIISLIKEDSIDTDAEVIGFVFPLYDFKAPEIVNNFVKKIKNLDSKYVFAVSTYGFMRLKAMKKFGKTIQSQGGKLAAGFAIQMPHNGIAWETATAEKQKEMFDNWKTKLETIKDYVTEREEGKIETSNMFVNFFLTGLFIKATPKLLSLLKQVILKGWNSLEFISDEKCDGCGVCAKVCLMNNISIVNDKPSWADNCLICFACLQWCPKEAIQLGTVTVKQKRYHHPEVKITDIIKQKQLAY
jgi:flavodoxin/Pyruvate/2-oxoacid:ferredoxin oxidoreductase delta subunit